MYNYINSFPGDMPQDIHETHDRRYIMQGNPVFRDTHGLLKVFTLPCCYVGLDCNQNHLIFFEDGRKIKLSSSEYTYIGNDYM